MKRLWTLWLLAAALLLLTGCSLLSTLDRNAREIPEGYLSASEHMQKDGIQDYADSCRYVFPAGETRFDEDERYQTLQESDEKNETIDQVKAKIDSFRAFMENVGRADECDCESSVVTPGDRYRLEEAKDGYTLWLFDREESTLYYIHFNV